ncbi:hypothetical protein NC653_008998 [Populus alba x Populus x berolinensis]|uniref:Uncharacterized protein n=1 Tax=Populus alba x Populus x berolinensis TaxID=444605 RepID=A0AAD6R887_9ROSI|nr:hypothetical protein NC653_008998 [Populus alba x Populus x berolinensis]
MENANSVMKASQATKRYRSVDNHYSLRMRPSPLGSGYAGNAPRGLYKCLIVKGRVEKAMKRREMPFPSASNQNAKGEVKLSSTLPVFHVSGLRRTPLSHFYKATYLSVSN